MRSYLVIRRRRNTTISYQYRLPTLLGRIVDHAGFPHHGIPIPFAGASNTFRLSLRRTPANWYFRRREHQLNVHNAIDYRQSIGVKPFFYFFSKHPKRNPMTTVGYPIFLRRVRGGVRRRHPTLSHHLFSGLSFPKIPLISCASTLVPVSCFWFPSESIDALPQEIGLKMEYKLYRNYPIADY